MPASPITGVGRAVLLVDDLDAALAFYHDVLGFEVLHDSADGGSRYLHVGVPGQHGVGVWLMPRGGATPPASGPPALVLYAADRDTVRTLLEDHGADVWAVADDPGSRSLHTRDPAGNVLVVAELKP
jgi:catechol 2,3-dioxygenase-like lactoylglutathione lyase family enzyme